MTCLPIRAALLRLEATLEDVLPDKPAAATIDGAPEPEGRMIAGRATVAHLAVQVMGHSESRCRIQPLKLPSQDKNPVAGIADRWPSLFRNSCPKGSVS